MYSLFILQSVKGFLLLLSLTPRGGERSEGGNVPFLVALVVSISSEGPFPKERGLNDQPPEGASDSAGGNSPFLYLRQGRVP